ncbi:hypothetical protein ABH931_001067 [Streptacidiphilus sp. MAP12-33]|uniref:hypothetical protein n=1 Tax=Streptacidiphilus sp. MAP12-33 TaxID=3156266 RepID=UPI00351605BE
MLVDGLPVIAGAFELGAAYGPEALLDGGVLRADPEPREVRLAEAWCTEGCCGALYVTVVREDDTVVWRDWRRPPARRDQPPRPELPTYRFDAAAYDAALARAAARRTWEWPAMAAARLLRERFAEQPDLLERWECAPGWIARHFDDRERLDVTFWYPRRSSEQGADEPRLQFLWALPVPSDASPRDVVDAAVARLAAGPPTGWARVTGGSRAAAETLGFDWPS